MLPSRYFNPQQHTTQDEHASGTTSRKKLKLSNSPSEKSDHLDEEEELPDINHLIKLTRAQHTSSQITPPTQPLLQEQPISDPPIQLAIPSTQPAHHTPTYPRLPTRTRLAKFLSSQCPSSSNNATSAPSSSKPTQTSFQTQKNFRIKLSNLLSTSVKYEQPHNIWQPGFENGPPNPISINPSQPPQPPHYDQKQELENQSTSNEDTNNKNFQQASRQIIQAKKPTQLEQQWAQFKKQYPHLIILIEVGFKIQLFGSDAIIASRVLSIGHLAIPGRESAFFPKTNLHPHLTRLIMAGYKVGLVSQSETKSLKITNPNSSDRHGLFKRHLSAIYSLSTWTEIDSDSGLKDPTTHTYDFATNSSTDLNSTRLLQNWIVSFYESLISAHPEKSSHNHRQVELNMVALCPQNGDIVWDSWLDDPIRSKLETRLLYFKPVEIILPLGGLHSSSEKLIGWMINDLSKRSYAKPRLESTERDYNAQTAYELVTRFCQPLPKHRRKSDGQPGLTTAEEQVEPQFLHHIVELPDGVLIALAGLIMHMKSYQLESIFRQPSQFKSFSSQSCMILDANTLRNLEIFENSTDRSERGSLFWVLDRTKTNMGKRLLKQWIGKPLVDFNMLRERADAIHELTINQNHPIIIKMRRFLRLRLPDLEKSLVRIQYGRCTEKELLNFLEVMDELTGTFACVSSASQPMFQSDLLNEIFAAFSAIREQTLEHRSELDSKAILKGEYDDMFTNADEKYPELIELKDCISCIQVEMKVHLEFCRTVLQNPKLEYITIGVDEMLIEVRIQNLDRVPEDWITMNSTKAVHRFRTPRAQELLEERNKYRDILNQTTRACFHGFLRAMEEGYNDFRNSIKKLALIDCLLSLTKTGIDNNYVKPTLVNSNSDDERIIEVIGGRHPIVEQLMDDPLVSNDFCFKKKLSNGRPGVSTMILTGNNMGGKSVTAKMIACIVILAQLGSYVPAQEAKIGIFDGCYTRMGMSEDLSQGRSAFMVEMSETSKIIKSATKRSLVIFDELGYGTSTYDGLAIASATLHHLVKSIECFTIFITHYPQLDELAIKYPNSVKSYHMKFLETPGSTKQGGHPEITFLYKLDVGLVKKSHGIHVAKLAGLPLSILNLAKFKSNFLQDNVVRKRYSHKISCVEKLLIGLNHSSSGQDVLKHPNHLYTSDLISMAQLMSNTI